MRHSGLLKVENRIYHVFQHTRSRDNALYCHMADDKDRDPVSLCDLHQEICRFPDLAHASRCRRDIFPEHCLDRVDDHHIRLCALDRAVDRVEICLA